jgi:hypothetical protein
LWPNFCKNGDSHSRNSVFQFSIRAMIIAPIHRIEAPNSNP